jgi:hypothetical protein
MLLSTEPETRRFLNRKIPNSRRLDEVSRHWLGVVVVGPISVPDWCSSSLSLSPDASRSHRFRVFVPEYEGSAVDNLLVLPDLAKD